MKPLIALAFAAATLAVTHPAPAQKIPVYVHCTISGNNEAAKKFCSTLRDTVALSPRYSLLTTDSQVSHYEVFVVTMRTLVGSEASSVVFTYKDRGDTLFLQHEVLMAGPLAVTQQAANVLVDLDTTINSAPRNRR